MLEPCRRRSAAHAERDKLVGVSVPERIGPYAIRGLLGEGGTGIVYDAVAEDGRAVALKVMHSTLAGDQQIRGRFKREAAILRRLDGAHVCPVLDLGEIPSGESTLLYLALPKIEGPSLAEILARGRLEQDRALDIALEVVDALASAHAHGVIHRDLKPANVILENEKKVVVVDFGMAKIVTGATAGTTNLTAHNMVFGTPEYMSPEQARGDDLDVRCDVYAAGIMIYEMLTGAPPFSGPTPLSVLTAHLTSDVPRPTEPMSPAVEAVILHALARDREKRYASAAALAAALRHARAAARDVEGVRPDRFVDRPSADAFAATIPANRKVDLSEPTLLNAGPAPMPKPRPVITPPPPEPISRGWVLLWIAVGLASIAAGVWFALRT
jgi:eukaryotic-like serine/threonine-protein kinase